LILLLQRRNEFENAHTMHVSNVKRRFKFFNKLINVKHLQLNQSTSHVEPHLPCTTYDKPVGGQSVDVSVSAGRWVGQWVSIYLYVARGSVGLVGSHPRTVRRVKAAE
jgi:hypothetical protein